MVCSHLRIPNHLGLELINVIGGIRGSRETTSTQIFNYKDNKCVGLEELGEGGSISYPVVKYL
jgi:hypothetical protein